MPRSVNMIQIIEYLGFMGNLVDMNLFLLQERHVHKCSKKLSGIIIRKETTLLKLIKLLDFLGEQ